MKLEKQTTSFGGIAVLNVDTAEDLPSLLEMARRRVVGMTVYLGLIGTWLDMIRYGPI